MISGYTYPGRRCVMIRELDQGVHLFNVSETSGPILKFKEFEDLQVLGNHEVFDKSMRVSLQDNNELLRLLTSDCLPYLKTTAANLAQTLFNGDIFVILNHFGQGLAVSV